MTAIPFGPGHQMVPGVSPLYESAENQFWYDDYPGNRDFPIVLDGSARDSGNTVTTFLRQGLALGGPIRAFAGASAPADIYKFKQWDLTATDGSQFFAGFLKFSQRMTDTLGNDVDRYTNMMIAGSVYADRVVIGGQTTTIGIGTGNNGRALMSLARPNFIFDKYLTRHLPPLKLPFITFAASPQTLTADDAGFTFTSSVAGGATTINLPSPLPGLGPFRFIRTVAQALIIDPGSATFTGPGTVTATGNISLDTIGAYVELIGLSTTQWLVTDYSGVPTAYVTIS